MSKRNKSISPAVQAMRERINAEKMNPFKIKYYFMQDYKVDGSSQKYIYRFGNYNIMQNQGA